MLIIDEAARAPEDIQLRKYYVYILIDPREDDRWKGIFYVGKGQGDRLNAHDEDGSAAKNELIAEIGNNKVIRRVVGSYSTEAEAYAVESVLIDFVFGRSLVNDGKLTNIQAGHNHRYVRPRGNYEELENLDIARRIGERVTGFISKIFNKLLENDIPALADDVIDQLNLIMANNQINGVILPIKRPGIREHGRFWGADVHFANETNVILRIQFTAKSIQTPMRAIDENTRIGRQNFTMQMVGLNIKPMNDGHYAWFREGWKGGVGSLPYQREGKTLYFSEYDALIKRITDVADALQNSRIQLINATPSESLILSEAISQNTSPGVL
ncbi:MAG: hypothetical protein RIQ94_2380 [Pseudomonadota bacterium]|jgi:hypothetical protein